MSGYTRIKRVTDPLDDKARARIVGRNRVEPDYVSSGSEHSAQADDDATAPSLSELFYGFSIDDGGESSLESGDSGCERDPSMYDMSDANVDLIKQILRNYGYNAAICKTKWQSSGGLTGGNYEFVDVLRTENSTRYFIDLDFASEFEIARPVDSYERLLQHLPRVFVGTSEDLKQILKVVSDAARRSLKSRDLHLPPWRKHRFMQNKWLGPYRRTDNLFPASFSSPSAVKQSYGVKCRAVGFNTANGGQLLFPATARTR